MTTPKPCAALLMCLEKYSAIGNSAIGNYVVLYSDLHWKQCYLRLAIVEMTKNSAVGGLLVYIKNSAIWKSVLHEAVLCEA